MLDVAAPQVQNRASLTYLQVCRAIAAMLVVVFHLGAAIAAEKYFDYSLFIKLFRFGSSGVEFFFVLSGFIISYVHLADFGRPERALPYLRRRAIRAYPAYWIIFLAVIAAALAIPAFREAAPQSMSVFLKSFLLAPQDPLVVGGTGAPVLIVAWSMQYELVFYAIFAAFIVSPRLGAGVLIGSCAWWLLSSTSLPVPQFPLHFMRPHFFAIFAIGVASSWATRAGRIRSPMAWLAAGLALYVLLAGYELWPMWRFDLHRPPERPNLVSLGYGVASGLLVCGLVAAEWRKPRTTPASLMLMGDASYTLYLLHFPMISAMCKVFTRFGRSPAWVSVSFVSMFILCCAASVAFHKWIEKPLLELLRRRFA